MFLFFHCKFTFLLKSKVTTSFILIFIHFSLSSHIQAQTKKAIQSLHSFCNMSPHHPLKRLTHPSTVIQKHTSSTSYGSHTNIQYRKAKEKDKNDQIRNPTKCASSKNISPTQIKKKNGKKTKMYEAQTKIRPDQQRQNRTKITRAKPGKG